MVYNAIIHKPGLNSNGRYYSPKVCKQIANLLTGVPVFPDVKIGTRDPKEAIGVVKFAESDKYGNVVAVLDLVSEPKVLGLAINAVGHTHIDHREGKQVVEIDDILKVVGVDLTDKPASWGQILL